MQRFCLARAGACAMGLALAYQAAAAPVLINYQGVLEDPELPPIANVAMEFRLWANPAAVEGEVLFWARRYSVRVDNGKFHVILGSEGLINEVLDGQGGAPLHEELDLALANGGRYLGITVIATDSASGETRGEGIELAPRQEFLSVPHAVASERLSGGLTEDEETELTKRPRFAFDAGRSAAFTSTSSALAATMEAFPIRAGALLKIGYRGTLFFDNATERTATVRIELVEEGVSTTVRAQTVTGNQQSPLTSRKYVHMEWTGFVGAGEGATEATVEVWVDGTNGVRIEAGAENQLLTVEELPNGAEQTASP